MVGWQSCESQGHWLCWSLAGAAIREAHAFPVVTCSQRGVKYMAETSDVAELESRSVMRLQHPLIDLELSSRRQYEVQ